MSSSTKHLLLLQIGPVQDFITAARNTDDLWSGSYLIAHLTASGIKYIKEHGGDIVFPCLDNQLVYQRLSNNSLPLGQPTLPNRFLALIPADKARDIASGAAGAIRAEMQNISKVCFDKFLELFPKSGEYYRDRWNDQVNCFLQIAWQTVEETGSNWGDYYKQILANLAARRNTRNFSQYKVDPAQNGCWKDALNGKDEIVGDFNEWKKVRNSGSFFKKDDKSYGAVNVIKRLWRECYLKNDKKVEESVWDLKEKSNGEAAEYIAAIQMDGDRMGSILSATDKDQEFFTRFSEKLANFTQTQAESIVKKHNGILVYAGGDDVLALLPACNAVKCAIDLRDKFCSDDQNMPGSEKNLCPESPRVTLSAGIAFCHWKTPLVRLIEEARSAEHRAKEFYDRNALALSVVKRSGEILQWGAKFDSVAWQLYDKFTECHRGKIVSGKFASALAMFTKQYNLDEVAKEETGLFADIVNADFQIVCKRQVEKDKKLPEDFLELGRSYIDELKEKQLLKDFPLLFLCANFLFRKPKEKKDNE